MLCLKLTIPVVDDEDKDEEIEDESSSQSDSGKEDSKDMKQLIMKTEKISHLRNWNRPLNSLHIFLGPFFASITTGGNVFMI